MTLPAILFALLIALLCGALFHFLRGREKSASGWRLLLYLGLSILGFALFQWLSKWQGWGLLMFGALDIGSGVIGSLSVMLFGDWLSRIETQDQSKV